jgi:hypothetical protein
MVGGVTSRKNGGESRRRAGDGVGGVRAATGAAPAAAAVAGAAMNQARYDRDEVMPKRVIHPGVNEWIVYCRAHRYQVDRQEKNDEVAPFRHLYRNSQRSVYLRTECALNAECLRSYAIRLVGEPERS